MRALNHAHHAALAYLDQFERMPAAATTDLSTLRARLDRPLTDSGADPEQVIDDLVRDVDGGLLGSAGGRFFGWVIGGTLPAALAADWLTTAWDQNAALYACAPAAAVVEEIAGRWLKELLALPPQASFAFVSGSQMAHATSLAAARHALLARRGWDVEHRGLSGAPAIRILSTQHRHGSIERAIRLLGLGLGNVITLPADERGRIEVAAVSRALSDEPTILLLQAGDINSGAYDRFEELIPLAHERGAWVHVDGAIGLWAAASPRLRHLVAGLDRADSWTTDGHKWLNVPYDCGYAFVADAAEHRAAMSHRAPYLTHDASARDQIDWNPEWSRRARGFPTYAALRQLGRDGVRDLIERCCDHATAIVNGIGALEGAEVVSAPVINQGLVRFLDPRADATEEDHDRRTDAVIAAILADGEAFFGGSNWHGRRVMRVSVCSWRTNNEDVRRAVGCVERAVRGI